jgi:hypothetical protein
MVGMRCGSASDRDEKKRVKRCALSDLDAPEGEREV